jgi:hypothetical protein
VRKSLDDTPTSIQPTPRNQLAAPSVQAGVDEIERAAIRDEGYDPDDPDGLAALDRVRAELAARSVA